MTSAAKPTTHFRVEVGTISVSSFPQFAGNARPLSPLTFALKHCTYTSFSSQEERFILVNRGVHRWATEGPTASRGPPTECCQIRRVRMAKRIGSPEGPTDRQFGSNSPPAEHPCAAAPRFDRLRQFLPTLFPTRRRRMAFCSKCGAQFDAQAAFCPKCGQPAGTAAGGSAPAANPSESGLTENVAGLLCYAVGWITGIVFLLIDKRPFVRFHAAQSIVTFGALTLLWIVMTMFLGGSLFYGGWGLMVMLFLLVRLAGLVLWILLMVKAYQHEKFRLPLVAELADGIAGK